MTFTIVDGLKTLRAMLPKPRALTLLDVGLAVLIAAHILALLSPPTPEWRLARAALAPFIAGSWAYLGYAWKQYNRRMYHIWAWVGLGEGVLGLPPSGLQLYRRAVTQPSSDSAPTLGGSTKLRNGKLRNRPGPLDTTRPASGSSTPIEFSPNGASAASDSSPQLAESPSPSPPPTAWSNLIKSVLVFTLSGLYHDISSVLLLLDALGRRETINARDVLSLSPFFLVQPIAIAAEAFLVPRFRAIKRARGIQRHDEGPLLTLVERAAGFAYVWLWLGWSAGFFVDGMARLGVWPVWEATLLGWNASLFVPLWKVIM
ncbi:uncharacterized protein CcaverHIS019_0311650 [Cutaneotrichosporon cavernicola]|uniref:Uncharacterized protein n=1 Tax=Cutaneotrichosporon cavernicola TaxID=279322 RepID=A0AA48QV74_9TREE|nr:uncharacterized protein CcaverHIS019_0311650 [Cutaneotrichosporon cavernicola]BEI91095.1 hypothetical protein CcaverHIS019_0311650 [Cutaneotrichosporon cavernicola]BEI98872.1 hypothetical protein CcaverHIS631_0311710 [Cutaneotrichosporon cavernicola]